MTVQNPYNLVNRTYEIGMSEISIREKCGLIPYYPLATGYLTGNIEIIKCLRTLDNHCLRMGKTW